MRKTGRFLLACVLSASLNFDPFFVQSSAHAADNTKSKKAELSRLQKRIKKLSRDLDTAQGTRRELNAGLRKLDRKIGLLGNQLRGLRSQIKQHKKRLQKLQFERRRAQKDIGIHRVALAEQIRSAYAMGRQEKIKLLLSQQDPAVVSRMLIYYDYLNKARTERMAALDGLLEDLQFVETSIQQENQRLNQLASRQVEEKQRIGKSRKDRLKLVRSINRDIDRKGDRLQVLKRDEKQLRKLLKQLQKVLAEIPKKIEKHKPFAALKGRLKWPTRGRLAVRYGATRKTGMRWEGVLISVPEGRDVKSVYHGRIAFADWLRGFGLLIIIDHGDGYMSLYGHNQTLLKETGDWVEPGDVIALAGTSGGQNQSGLYFGIRHNSKPMNPTQWCQKGKGNRVGSVFDSQLPVLSYTEQRLRPVEEKI